MGKSEITTEELAEEILKIKLKVYARVTEIEDAVANFKVQMVQASEDRQKGFALQTKMSKELDELFKLMRQADERFANHDEKEMKKYDEIVKAIYRQSTSIEQLTETLQNTIKETNHNTSYITEARFEAEKDKAVAEALEKEKAPYQEYKRKAINVVVGVVVTGMTIGLWKLTVLVISLDKAITGN